ncbi:MAG: serine/threonine-protein kinase [Planctomyces sp.]
MPLSETQHDDGAQKPEDDLSNTRVGEFLLIRRLGAGGMAEVYLADQTSLDRSVAVKILRTKNLEASGQVLLKRFEQEAKAAAGLNHSNIVQVFTTGRHEELHYIVQEYVSGMNLSQWIRRNGCPDYGTGLRWMQQIASALKAASDAGVIHRDIKPENIMITRSGVAKVTDFGLAQLSQAADRKMNLTQAGTTMGTPWYMSPEQIQGDKLDHRSDQYSFGITAFHMFTGRPPFPGRNAMVVAMQHLKENPPSLSQSRADLPRPLCDMIERMMSKRVDNRFPGFDALENALLQLNSVPVNSRLQLQPGWRSRIMQWLPSFRWLIPACLVASILGFVVAGHQATPARLPVTGGVQAIPKEASASAQFAVAMLNPRNSESWQAVMEHYPGTSEAEIAQMRLALRYLQGPVPQYERAKEQFEKLTSLGAPKEKRHLRFLGLIGQAMTISLQKPENADAAAAKVSEAEAVFSDGDPESSIREALEKAPRELREFYEAGPGEPDPRRSPQ